MARGVLLDIDGVLTVSWHRLAGAAETVAWLREHDVDFRLVTNTSSKTRRQIAALLADAGMPVEVDHILTAVTSAAGYLERHHPGVGCFVLNEGDMHDDLGDVRQTDAAEAGVVLLGGAGPHIGYDELDAAFKLAVAGAPIVALHRNTRFQTADGPALDMGAFIVGLEAAADVEATIVGKPAPAFYEAALADLGCEAAGAVMVGDDIASDVVGAQYSGITGVLVRTGKFRATDLDGRHGRPDYVIDDIGALPVLLEELG